MLRALGGLIWKDVKMFGVDRQALVMSVAVPVVIASILGWLDSSSSDAETTSKIPVMIVDEDRSKVSQDLLSRLSSGKTVTPVATGLQAALGAVRQGSTSLAVVIPKGFGSRTAGLFNRGAKPEITLYGDPAHQADAEIASGAIEESASEAAAKASFGPLADIGPPISIRKENVAVIDSGWAKAAHDYAGFGLQGLLFFAIESAVALGRERRQGIWKRLRSAPIRPNMLLLAKGLSSCLLALGVILLIFAVGALLFHVRTRGTGAGFALIAVCSAAMAGTFGLLVATLGKTETQSRALSILIILVMLATGGAWFPMDRMPPAVQSAANFMPVRWAVEGFDAATWRGLNFATVAPYGAKLAGFALIFGLLASMRFRSLRDSD